MVALRLQGKARLRCLMRTAPETSVGRASVLIAVTTYYSCGTIGLVASRATSYRLDPSVKSRLERQATAEGITERALLERLVTEGLDTLHHPGVVYRDGPTGRRAALAVGPDIWEVVSALRHTSGRPEDRVATLAEQFDLHPRHIRTAIDFAARHREAIDAEVEANDRAAQDAREVAARRADLMAR